MRGDFSLCGHIPSRQQKQAMRRHITRAHHARQGRPHKSPVVHTSNDVEVSTGASVAGCPAISFDCSCFVLSFVRLTKIETTTASRPPNLYGNRVLLNRMNSCSNPLKYALRWRQRYDTPDKFSI